MEERVIKKIIYENGIPTIRWVLESECSMCGCEMETIFDSRPSEIQVLEASFIPCDECMEKIMQEEKERFRVKNPKKKILKAKKQSKVKNWKEKKRRKK